MEISMIKEKGIFINILNVNIFIWFLFIFNLKRKTILHENIISSSHHKNIFSATSCLYIREIFFSGREVRLDNLHTHFVGIRKKKKYVGNIFHIKREKFSVSMSNHCCYLRRNRYCRKERMGRLKKHKETT